MKKFYIFFLFPFFANTTISQSYYFRHFTIENGLSQSQVNSICQDQKGNMWFATNGGGANKYDGKSFTYYTTKNGLKDNVVRKILADSKGNTWFATAQGLTRFDGLQFTTFTTENKLSSNSISTLLEDKNGNLWIGTANGVDVFDGERFSNFSEKNPELSGNIYDIFQDSKENIWIAAAKSGLCKYSGDSLILFNKKNGFEGEKPFRINEDLRGSIWIATLKSGLFRYDGNLFKSYRGQNSFTDFPSYSLFRDKKGNLWIGTWVGLFRYNYNTDSFSLFSTNEGLGNNQVMAMTQDREGNLWLATNSGADMFPLPVFTNFDISDGLLDNLVYSISKDKKGNIWFGTGQGVQKFDVQMQITGDSLRGGVVKTTFEDSFGELFVGTGAGLIIFDHEKIPKNCKNTSLYQKCYSDKIDKNASFTQIIEDKSQNIWMATYGYGVYKILKDRKTIINYTTADGLCDNTVRSLFEDEKGIIWFGTGSGKICSFDGRQSSGGGLGGNVGSFSYFDEKDGLTNQRILSIVNDDKKNLWLGGYSGICRYDGKKFKWITDADGLATNTIYSLLYDDKKYLWIGSINGLDKFDVEEYNKSGKILIKHYGKEDGFTGIECNPGAVYKDKSGNLWFGTIKGAFRYNPENDKINDVPPQTNIISLRLFFENVDWLEYSDSINPSVGLPVNLSLPYEKNHLTFDYIGISLTVPEKVKYRYQLVGLDENWSPVTKENKITYSNLSPGDYSFRVISCNNDGIWNESPSVFNFIITPPFWRTWWFYLLCISSLAVTVFSYVRLREKKLRCEKEILEQRVKLRTREIDNQKKIIEEKNKDIMDSIHYAKCIQEAILPAKQKVRNFFPDAFVFFRPKDIVSGDFYWMSSTPAVHRLAQTFTGGLPFSGEGETTHKAANADGKVLPPAGGADLGGASVLIAVADCTGHGVPGAFMSMIGSSQLTQIVVEKKISKPSEILDHLNKGIKQALQTQGESIAKDGMDIALVKISFESRADSSQKEIKENIRWKVEYAGANRPLFIIRKKPEVLIPENNSGDQMLIEIKPDKTAIGGFTDAGYLFKNNEVEILPGDKIYLFSDGFADQFGGKKKKKFMNRQFRDLLTAISNKPMIEQEMILGETINEWKGELEQVDDWLVVGIRL